MYWRIALAGLLARSIFNAFPPFYFYSGSGLPIENINWNLQQRGLLRIHTGFPFKVHRFNEPPMQPQR